MRRLIFPILLGVAGVAILLSLGVWQVQRLDWKRGLLSEIDSRISAAPVTLTAAPTEAEDEYRTVTVDGRVFGPELHVLTSGTAGGTGYRVIRGFETADGRRIMIDMGLLPLGSEDELPAADEQGVTVTGNLLWPDDKTSSTPAPDLAKNIWFARDVPAMADALEVDPVLVVLRDSTRPDPRLVPLPVDTSGIKNDHREYAITWFLRALVWAAMTGYLIFRTIRAAPRKE